MIERYVLGFEEIDRTQVALVGDKAMHLAELSRTDGIRVPAGFCVTTEAFRRVVAGEPFIREQIDHCARTSADDHEAVGRLNAEVRATLEAVEIPQKVASQITLSLARLGEHSAYAVRSSATAEDLPAASFAGQQDTHMGIVGAPLIGRRKEAFASYRALTVPLFIVFCFRPLQSPVSDSEVPASQGPVSPGRSPGQSLPLHRRFMVDPGKWTGKPGVRKQSGAA